MRTRWSAAVEVALWTPVVLLAHVCIAGTAWASRFPLAGAVCLSSLAGGFGASVYTVVQPRLPQLQQNEQQAKPGRANPKLDEHCYVVYTSVSGLIALLQKAWLVQWLLDSEAAAQYIWRTPPSWQSTLVAYWCILLMYDVIYYWFHRSFLHSRFGFSHVHCFHHQLSTPRSLLDAVYLHPIEAFVGMWLLYLPLVLTTRLGLPVHISAVGMWEASIALMVIYHSGMDVPWPSTPLWRRHEMNKSPVFSIAAHDLHHSDARCNYALFTRWVDAAFGTEGQGGSSSRTR